MLEWVDGFCSYNDGQLQSNFHLDEIKPIVGNSSIQELNHNHTIDFIV